MDLGERWHSCMAKYLSFSALVTIVAEKISLGTIIGPLNPLDEFRRIGACPQAAPGGFLTLDNPSTHLSQTFTQQLERVGTRAK